MRAYFRPIPSTDPAKPANALRLAGGWTWFDRVEVLQRQAPPRIVSLDEVPAAELAALTAPRAALADVSLELPRLMGIFNATPDSFSDGGRYIGAAALARAREMQDEGADIFDIGGESTRPGALEVPEAVELARIEPVIAALMDQAAPVISVDTRKANVAQAGLRAGAAIINDVSGLRFDPSLVDVVAGSGAALVLMHSIGTPDTMQADAKGAYSNVLLDVYDTLSGMIDRAISVGIPRERILVDPGIGFGKSDAQNLALISRVSLFHGLGCALLLGVSRKGFIGRIGAEPRADKRGPGSAGVGLWALGQGVQILRVHDIALHRQAIDVWRAVQAGS